MSEQRGIQSGTFDDRSRKLRLDVVELLSHSRRGHVGSAFSLIEILRVLYDDVLRFDPKQPAWDKRDRFILSKGHGCMALYVLLAEKGFFPKEELRHFCAFDGILGGHPDGRKTPGVETATGSLGHGLAMGLGMALHARIVGGSWRVFVVMGDGECDEGSVWEGAMIASKHGLSNLTVVVDYNKMQSYDTTRVVQDLEPFSDKWRSFGFGVTSVDGHDVTGLRAAFEALPLESNRPSVIICHTVKGKGISFMENNARWHHKNRVTDEEIAALRAALEQ